MPRTPRSLDLVGTALVVTALVAGATASLAPAAVAAPPAETRASAPVPTRLVVHFDDADPSARDDRAAQAAVDAVGRQAGERLSVVRRLATGGALVAVDAALDDARARGLVQRFLAAGGVADAEVDALMTADAAPDPSDYAVQWHYSDPVSGARLPAVWGTWTGAGVTVAVLDTGITAHPDLDANVVAGYDFISTDAVARDGGGRDGDPSDPGDWYAAGECGQSTGDTSSWHGTHVAGTVAAASDTSGAVGVAFGAKVQPVRVLGKCGGYLSDIADAIVWASGGAVSGVPANATPARVINMSLGGSGRCATTYQKAINAAVGRGTTVVVAAGNSSANASGFQPASCSNVVVVAASDRDGAKAWYSNTGKNVDVTAPGGDTRVAGGGVWSTLNTGTQGPVAAGYAAYQGTSMATPHVAGLAALVLQKRPGTSASQVESWLKSGTRPLPVRCTACGAGLVDATRTLTTVVP